MLEGKGPSEAAVLASWSRCSAVVTLAGMWGAELANGGGLCEVTVLHPPLPFFLLWESNQPSLSPGSKAFPEDKVFENQH